MSTHDLFHYSITIKTDDEAVLGCLRSLSQYAQKTGNARIPWGGTKRKDWETNSHQVTFHFTTSSYREDFHCLAKRILLLKLWRFIEKNDNDPAAPQ